MLPSLQQQTCGAWFTQLHLSLPVFLPLYYSLFEGLRGRHELTSVKKTERAMPVVTTRAVSQNSGLATVLVGSAAPTGSGLAINVL